MCRPISKWETRNSASTPTSDLEIEVTEPSGTQLIYGVCSLVLDGR